jgi:hypothetical protein
MIQRLSHAHPLYADDNGQVYDDLELATRGSRFASSIAPFKRARDGRAAFLALKSQHAGPAYWDDEQKTQNDFMLNRKFTGGTSTSLEHFLSQHRQAFTLIQRCSMHVACQVPDDRTRVGYLIDNIECADADVKAALAAIKMDDSPPGMRNDFERAAAMLLPVDPVKNKSKRKRANAEISMASARSSAAQGGGKPTHKVGIGKTKVPLRFHTSEEYRLLNKDQRTELREWRASQRGNDNPGKPKPKKFAASSKKLRGTVASVIKEMRDAESQQVSNIEEFKAIIASIASEPAAAAGPTLAEIAASRANPSAEKAKPAKKGVKFSAAVSEAAAAEVAAVKLQDLMGRLGMADRG